MEKRIHLYVSKKNVNTWLMLVCMISSIVLRIAVYEPGAANSPNAWVQMVLPVAASLLYILFAFIRGEEFFFLTTLPVCMMTLYSAIWTTQNIPYKLIVWLIWIALIFL